MSSFLESTTANDRLELRLLDAWRIDRIAEIERDLRRVPAHGVRAVTVDTSALSALDLGPASLLRDRLQALADAGAKVEFSADVPETLQFVNTLHEGPETGEEIANGTRWLQRALNRGGELIIAQLRELYDAVGFFGRLVVTFLRAIVSVHRLRLPSVARHVYETGVLAIPIVSLIAFLISVIVAYLGAQQLQQFGAEIFTVDLVAIAVLRELGVLLTAIIVAGRSGSAFAAEIGVMRLNDETDALQSMGMDQFEVLVAPRVLGLMIALPLLTVVADAMGLAGGALLSAWLIDVPLEQFIPRVQGALAPTTFWAGLIKAPVFAFVIALVGAYRGMQVRDSSRELGRLTTAAVVQSIFLVIFVDAVFAVIFVEIDF
ncbi:MAG TPA: ABC transporter permease [Steroidobacteraceae bacterium]|nr:ABC transporter permease [Steroidobacteraceae bacterium]